MIRDHVPAFVYEESEVLDALISAAEEELERFKEHVKRRVLSWYLETSSGKELDRIGLLVGEPRRGRSDEEYRSAILSRVSSTAGTKEVLLNVARSLTDDTAQVEDLDPGVVKVSVNAERFPNMDQKIVIDAINRVKVAGVHPQFDWHVFESTKVVLEERDDVRIVDPVSPETNVDLQMAVEKVEPLLPTTNISLNEALDLPLIEEDSGLPLETTVSIAEIVENSTHELPYTWAEAVADFSEWS